MRDAFPFFLKYPDLIYFDSAATTLKPKEVVDKMSEFYLYHSLPVHRAVYQLAREATALYEEVRTKVKRLIHASSEEEIVFTRGATSALNMVAKGCLKKGDKVLVGAIEHHSNLVPWQMVEGLSLEFIPVDETGAFILEAYEKLLEGVKLVSIAQVSNVTGNIHPVKEMIRMAHAKGAKVCVDGAQAISHFSVDVQELDADFYLFSGHKMYGPTGVGVLYGKKELLEKMAPSEGGGHMIDQVRLDKTTYGPSPQKFEAGTPMTSEVIGLGAAIDFLEGIGLDKVGAYETQLVAYAVSRLQELNVRLLGNPKSSLLTFTSPLAHPLDMATLLDIKGVCVRSGHLCSQPAMDHFKIPAAVRLSFGIYNSKAEIDRFIKHLTPILHSCTAEKAL